MQMFAYEARNEDGLLTAGRIKAQTLEQAGELLSQQRLFVIRMAAEKAGSRQSRMSGHATRAQVAWQMSQLSVMVKTGVRLTEALECLARQARQPRLKLLLEQVSKDVQEGRPLSEAMAVYPKTFSPSIIALIRASEMSGTMSLILQRSAGYLLNELQVLRRVRGAMLYPAFMFTACLGVTVFLLTAILPRFADIFASRGAVLPLPTRILMGLSEHLVQNWYLWLGGLALAAVGGSLSSRTQGGRRLRDQLMLSIPILSKVFRLLYQSRAFRTMAVLLEAGVPLVDAIKVVQDVAPNCYYRELWMQVDQHIQRGERMAVPLLASDLIPESVSQMIDSGDRAGKLGFVFAQLADFTEEEYNQAVRTATQFIEPCMIMCMGGIVGLTVASVMLPLFQSSFVLSK